jgi:hypothetical protein
MAVDDAAAQGQSVDELSQELETLPDSLDALSAFAERLSQAPLRDDWPWVEPDGLDEIRLECDAARPLGTAGSVDPPEQEHRIRAAWLARVAGCVLGKPIEIDPTFDHLRDAAGAAGDAWPLDDYVSEATLDHLPARQPQWTETIRGRITHVAEDDDLNYTVLALRLLESKGTGFTREDLLRGWLFNLPVLATFGPERSILLRAALDTFPGEGNDPATWTRVLNPGAELCGALIRADAYGWASPGRPELAAELAWRDAGTTHRRTGLYSAMWVAAWLALIPLSTDPLSAAEAALAHVPGRSRFADAARRALEMVRSAEDWEEGYRRVHAEWPEHTHCRVYQEVGTLLNTARFAKSAGHGIGLQVSQGNDTDSFGATAGSVLGLWFGEIEPRWIEPFGDRIHLALALEHESSLTALAGRFAGLPARLAPAITTQEP